LERWSFGHACRFDYARRVAVSRCQT
jgi:hypothetical protein